MKTKSCDFKESESFPNNEKKVIINKIAENKYHNVLKKIIHENERNKNKSILKLSL